MHRLERQPFAAENPLVNLDLRPPDPPLRQERPVHEKVTEAREYDLRIQAHDAP
jgi:hypothetical protein